MRRLIIAAFFVNTLGAFRTALEGKTDSFLYFGYSLVSLVFGLWWVIYEYFAMKGNDSDE